MIDNFDGHSFELGLKGKPCFLNMYFTCKNCKAVFYLDFDNTAKHSAESIFFTGDRRIFPPKCEEAQKLLNMIGALD